MNKMRRLWLVLALSIPSQCAAADTLFGLIGRLPFYLENLLDGVGETSTSLKSLNYRTSDSIGFKVGGMTFGFTLGGPGAGSFLTPLPKSQRPIRPLVTTPVVAPKPVEQGVSDIVSGALFDLLDDDGVDLFRDKSNGKDVIQRLLSFRITPGMIYVIKLGLLVHDYIKNGHENDANTPRYLIDFGILSVRLLRSWGIEASGQQLLSPIFDKHAVLKQTLEKVSLSLPETVNKNKDPRFLHNKLDSFWSIVVNPASLLTGNIGSNYGIGISGFECRDEREAQVLTEFLQRPGLKWKVIEQQSMTGSFADMVATIFMRGAMQVENQPEEVQEAFELAQEVFDSVLDREAVKEYGRYNTTIEKNVNADQFLKESDEFQGHLHQDGALGRPGGWPRVVKAGNRVLLCSKRLGMADAARVLSAVFFYAMWRYVDVLRQADKASKAQHEELARKQEADRRAAEYLKSHPFSLFGDTRMGPLAAPRVGLVPQLRDLFVHDPEMSKMVRHVASSMQQKRREGMKNRAAMQQELVRQLEGATS